MLARKLRILAVLPVLAVLFQGCVNEEGTYNDFLSRQKALQEGGTTDSGSDADALPPCTPPAPGDINGQYLFVLSALNNGSLLPPVMFLADLKTVAYSGGTAAYQGGTGLTVTLHALDQSDRKTIVGSPITIPQLGIGSDGVIEPKPIPTITIPGAADPLVPGTDIIAANVALIGQMCSPVQDFYCGTITGSTTSPLQLSLDGSPYTLQVVSDPNSLPLDPTYVNCAKDPAPPLK